MDIIPVVVVLSGKRKSGKDFVAELLQKKLGHEKCVVLRLSGPLKKQYAKEHGLDFTRLLDSTEYKETFRKDMILWGEEKRNKDPGYFCRLATYVEEADKKLVWIISDARRPSDLLYFKNNYKDRCLCVRISCCDEVRNQRGFVFTKGVDDAESECALDHVKDWNFVINNDNNQLILDEMLNEIVKIVNEKTTENDNSDSNSLQFEKSYL